MAGKIVVLGVVILIVILAGYLVHDSLALKKMKETDVKTMFHEAAADRGPKILNGPTISYRCPGDSEYHHIQMTKKKITIGKDPSNDIVLEDDSAEGKHAFIEKKVKGNSVCYEFVNLSRYNLAEYYNQSSNIYEYLAYKQGVVLDDKEGFYIGETKLVITLPKTYHAPSKTERMIINREEMRRTEATVVCKGEPSLRAVFKDEIDI